MVAQTVRIATLADAGAIAAIYAPYVTQTAISFEIDPPGEAEMAARIEAVLARFPWLVFERDGEVLGYAYASRHRDRAAYQWSADAAVYVAPGGQRQGIGRALYTILLEILRLQGFQSVFGGITLPNAASVSLHEALGFLPVGVYRKVGFKLGAWRDVGWWGLALGEAPAEPWPPATFDISLLERVKRI